MRDHVDCGCGKKIQVVLVEPDQVYHRAAVLDVLHYDPDRFPTLRAAVFWEIPGGEGRPFMRIDFRCRAEQDDPPLAVQQVSEAAQQLASLGDIGNIVKGKRRQNEIESATLDWAEVAIVNQPIRAARVGISG